MEFPWVLFDTKTGAVVDTKQFFIRPVEVPKLTKFCTGLTGIKQEQVDNGILLKDALIIFEQYCQNLTDSGKKFAVVTDSEWDLKFSIIF